MSAECFCTNASCRSRHLLPDTVVGESVPCVVCGEPFVARPVAAAAPADRPSEVFEPAWDTAPTVVGGSTVAGSTVAGNKVGRFVIRGKLGVGTFGTVFHAYDPQLDRVVALKVPNPGVMTDATR